jgi:FAD:protein FMN transferase
MKTATFKSMGTDIELITIGPAAHALKIVNTIFEQEEARFSRFKQDSELTRLNKSKSQPVSPEMWEVFTLASDLHTATNAAFNPLLAVKNLGYVTSYTQPSVPSHKQQNTDFLALRANSYNQSISLHKDQELDFGGIVKGWTVDKAAQTLKNLGYQNFLINAGGDIYASGTLDGQPWKVGVENSQKVFQLRNQAIATSGKTRRHWQDQQGKQHHHILDPQTKQSADNDLAAITIIGSTTAECDAWATAAFALGKEQGQNLLIKNHIKYFLSL